MTGTAIAGAMFLGLSVLSAALAVGILVAKDGENGSVTYVGWALISSTLTGLFGLLLFFGGRLVDGGG